MPKGTPWSDETRAKVDALSSSGMAAPDIAGTLGMNCDSIRGYLKRSGQWVYRSDREHAGDPTSAVGRGIVERFQAGRSVVEIAAEFGVGETIVRKCLKAANAYETPDHFLNRLDDAAKLAIVERYRAGESVPKLAKEVGVAVPTVCKWLERFGVDTRSASDSRRVRVFNEAAFSEDSETMRYWVGFLMADGCISDHGTRSKIVSIGLKDSDRGHIEKFRDFLGSDHDICESTHIVKKKDGTKIAVKSVRISVSSDRMAADLSRFGVVPRKSKTAKISILEDDRDFWRGVFDGDGSLFRSDIRPVATLVGSPDLLGQFREFVRLRIPECHALVNRHKAIRSFSTTGSFAQRIIEILYRNCTVALDRKAEIAGKFIENPYRVPGRYLARQARFEDRRAVANDPPTEDQDKSG